MVQRAETDFDQALTERLSAAVQELNLPATVVLMRAPQCRMW
jgi:hypothetical protein